MVTSTGVLQSDWSCPRTIANRTQTLAPLAPVTTRVLPCPTPSCVQVMPSALSWAAYSCRVGPVSWTLTVVFPCPLLGGLLLISPGTVGGVFLGVLGPSGGRPAPWTSAVDVATLVTSVEYVRSSPSTVLRTWASAAT